MRRRRAAQHLVRPQRAIGQTLLSTLAWAAAVWMVYQGVNIAFVADDRFRAASAFTAANASGGAWLWGGWLLGSGVAILVGAALAAAARVQSGDRIAFTGMLSASTWAFFFGITLELSAYPSVTGSTFIFTAVVLAVLAVAVKHSNRDGRP